MKVLKFTLKALGIIIGIAVLAIFALFYYATQMSCHENEEPTVTDRQKAEITRLSGFIDQYSPDDESYWARDEAVKQLSLVTGKDSDFYQDQAHIASAWSYVFYGMSYLPMCHHSSTPYKDLKGLSDNIVILDSLYRYSAEELSGLQLKAIKAQAYYHHAQGIEDGYKAKKKMIAETENRNKGLSVRRQLMNNQILFYKLIVQDIASMGKHIDEEALEEVKAAAASIASYTINDDGKLKQMSETDFRSNLSNLMSANCKVLSVFNNGIAKTVNDQKMLEKVNSKI